MNLGATAMGFKFEKLRKQGVFGPASSARSQCSRLNFRI